MNNELCFCMELELTIMSRFLFEKQWVTMALEIDRIKIKEVTQLV